MTLKKALIWSGVCFWLLVLILLFGKAFAQQGYRITTEKALGWGILAVAGFADGAVEGYEFDGRKSFERKWGADPAGFWGSQSWRLAYTDGDPEQGYRNAFTRFYGAPDFYHVADDARKYGYITGGVTVGIGAKKTNNKWWHYAIDFGISFAVSGLTKRAGMDWVRN